MPSSGKTEGVPRLSPHPLSRRLGGLCQAALRWSRTRFAVSGPVHASCRDLESPAHRSHRHPRDVPLERLRPWQQTAEDDLDSRGVSPSFPGTCFAERTPTDPIFRLSGQSSPRCVAPLGRTLLATAPPIEVAAVAEPALRHCPRCQGPMRVLEFLTA